jgi:Ni,Fe-hydrogenase I large subunit
MGIEGDKVEQIIGAHTDTVNGLKEELDQYKDNADKLAKVQKDLDKANKKLEKYEADDSESPYKKQYEDMKAEYDKLKGEFDKYKADVDAKAQLAKKSNAYKTLLKETGVSEKRLDSILKVTNLDEVELDDDGNIKDKDKLKEEIKKEWSDFIATKREEGAGTPNPPAGNGAGGRNESIASKLAARYHENLYGKAKEA